MRLMPAVDLIQVSPDEWSRVAQLLFSRGYRETRERNQGAVIFSPDGLTCVSDWRCVEGTIQCYYLDACILKDVSLEELCEMSLKQRRG